MDSESKFWLTLWTMVGICITVVVVSLCITDLKENKLFAENGYEQVMLPSAYYEKWQKVKWLCLTFNLGAGSYLPHIKG